MSKTSRMTRKQAHYNALLRQHFVPQEARAFCQIKKWSRTSTNKRERNPAIAKMVRVRSAMWANFSRYASDRGLSGRAKESAWNNRVWRFYAVRQQAENARKVNGGKIFGFFEGKGNWIVERAQIRGKWRRIRPTISPFTWYKAVLDSMGRGLSDEWGSP